jgi:hypothetical protein
MHSEELHNLYASPNFVRVIKSRRMNVSWGNRVGRHGLDACGLG